MEETEETGDTGFQNSAHIEPTPSKSSMTKYSQKVMNQLLATPESKREKFRLYLEHTQIMDALSRFFVQLYDETGSGDTEEIKPEKVLCFLTENISTLLPVKARVDELRMDVENLHQRFAVLEQENQRLREALQMYETPLITHEEIGEFEWIGEQEGEETGAAEDI